MKRLLGMAVLGAVVFAASLVGFLALRGRLHHEGTRGIPLLGSVFPAPASDREEEDPEAASTVAPTAVAPQGAGAEASGASPAALPRLFAHPEIPSRMTAGELVEALASLEERRRRNEREREDLVRQREELGILAADLEERRRSLRSEMAAVQAASDALDARVREMELRTTLLRQQEQRNFRDQAQRLAAMDPASAAEVLLGVAGEDGAQDGQAVKILAAMEADDAAAILGAMDPSRGARLVEKGLGLVREPAAERSR